MVGGNEHDNRVIIYGVVVLIAIIITPLSIRARRKTLNEIELLKSSFNRDVEALAKKLNLE